MSAVVFLNKDIYLNFEDGYFYKCYKKLEAHLRPQEKSLLKLLVSHSGTVCTYEYIYDSITSERNVVHVSIRSIKSWFERLKLRDDYICTISGIGYSFDSGYHVVELLETAPNIIEPLTLKDNFVEEPELLDKIFNAFEEGNKVVFLSGISGSGKSELARSFSSRYKNTFYSALHFALTPDGNGSFEDLIAENDKFFWDTGFEKDQKIKVRKEVLKKLGKESLIIIDNFNCDKNLDFLNDVCGFVGGIRPTGAAKILITSTLSGNAFANYLPYGCKVIEVEKERDKKQLAYDILARKAGISESENKDIEAIVRAIGYHPLCSAIIGAQIKEYDLDMAYLRDIFSHDLKKALTSGESVLFRKDNINADFKPYEILKYIFKNVSKKLTEIERQVLGAYLLLPKLYHKKDVLSEFVGDIRYKCSRAKGAICNLQRKCLIEIDKDGTIILHPLLEELFQDSGFLESETSVAELSDDYKCLLLRNFFVSDFDKSYTLEYLFWDVGFRCSEYNFYKTKTYPNTHIFDEKQLGTKGKITLFSFGIQDIRKTNIENVGWILHRKTVLDLMERNLLVKCIQKNSCRLPTCSSIKEADLAALLDLSDLERTGLIFVVECENGRAIILYDYERNKQYCLVNSTEQLLPENRYLNEIMHEQKGKPIFARFVGTLCGKLPETLIIPQKICDVPVTEVYRNYFGDADIFRQNLKMLSIPDSVNIVAERSFVNCSNLKSILFLSKSLKILPYAFFGCSNLKNIFFNYYPIALGAYSFRGQNSIKQIAIPNLTTFQAPLDCKKAYELALELILEEGKYYVQKIKSTNTREHQCVFDISKILGGWRYLNDVYDETGNNKLDWDELFQCWSSTKKSIEYGIKCDIGDYTIGKDVFIHQNNPKEYPIFILPNENLEFQISWWDIHKGLNRLQFPFYRFGKNPTNIVITKSMEEHIRADRLNAKKVVEECLEIANKKSKKECSLSYAKFAKHFMEARPELFLNYGKDF